MPDLKFDEIVEQVTTEIKEIGATSKKNYDELNKQVVELRDVLEKQGENDYISKEHIAKLEEDITTRQNEIDTAVNKRADDIEVAMQRIKPALSNEDKELEKSAVEFYKANRAANGGLKHRELKKYQPNVQEYAQYKEVLDDYLRFDKDTFTPEEAKALSVGSDPDGGYTVTPEMSGKIFDRIFESDPIRQLCNVMSITTGAVEFLVDVDEADASWEDERNATDETDTPNMNKLRIPVHILSARPRATQVLLDDSSLNMESWLSMKVADKFSRTEAAAFVSGDGIGKPRGFLDYSAWATAGTYEFGKIEQVNLGDASNVTTDGLQDLKYSMVEFYLTRGTWLMNRLTVRDVMKLKDGDGQYIWRPGIELGQPSVLLGLPVRMSTTMPVVAANALSFAIADWKKAYTIVDRMGINVQRDPYTAKPFVEFYTRKRVGGDVTDFQAIKIGKISA